MTDLLDIKVTLNTPIPINYDWKMELELGNFQELPERICQIFSAFDHISNLKHMKITFVFDQKKAYAVETASMKVIKQSSDKNFSHSKNSQGTSIVIIL